MPVGLTARVSSVGPVLENFIAHFIYFGIHDYRTQHVPRRGSYSLFRDCHEEARSLAVSLLPDDLFSRLTDRFCSLRYVKSAKASTDVPTTVPEFISQRRRWLNGSLFAAIHATVFWFRIWTSGQNFFRKIFLNIEFLYNAVQLFFTWTSLANFYLAFFFVSISLPRH